MNFALLTDDVLVNEFMNFEAHYNVPDLSKPYSVCGNLTLLACTTNIVGNFLSNDTPHASKKDSIYNRLNKVEIK